MKSSLKISGKQIQNGIELSVQKKKYKIIFPNNIWSNTPSDIRQALYENLVFANTHYLPLILGYTSIDYNTSFPLLESFWYKNMLYDLIYCEKVDNKPLLHYVKNFYNLNFSFASVYSSLPHSKIYHANKTTAILPFTFGKESLVTMGMCMELGIKPILIYSQEPIQPYEEKYKKKVLKFLSSQYKIDSHFIKNDPGLFRYSGAFPNTEVSEIGWGTQTTILALMSIPFAYNYKAQYIFIGSEFSNNTVDLADGWRLFPSYDQTSFWSVQQRNMIRILTHNSLNLYSSLQPLEQIHIFYMLHHRYPDLGKLQFSCSAKKPLVKNSQWCHQCYKCCRMYMYALCCDIIPEKIGFKSNLFKNKNLYLKYFKEDIRWGFPIQLAFNYHLLKKKKLLPSWAQKYLNAHLPEIRPWQWYKKHFNTLKSTENLPPQYNRQLLQIFNSELESFAKNIM